MQIFNNYSKNTGWLLHKSTTTGMVLAISN